ncbi:hypothetical protein R3X48_06655, partial [Salmonella enterica subsp. enterica serovar Typhimurium]
FCFIALMGASSFELSGTFIVSLIILMFYGRKMRWSGCFATTCRTAAWSS